MTSMKTLAITALATAAVAAPAPIATAQASPPDICVGYSGMSDERARTEGDEPFADQDMRPFERLLQFRII